MKLQNITEKLGSYADSFKGIKSGGEMARKPAPDPMDLEKRIFRSSSLLMARGTEN